MFRITCYVEDRHLAEVLRALAGRAREVSAVPANVGTEAPSPKANGKMPGVDSLKLVVTSIKKSFGPNPFAKSDVVPIVQKLGWAPSSANYYLARATKAGMLKQLPKKGKTNALKWVLA